MLLLPNLLAVIAPSATSPVGILEFASFAFVIAPVSNFGVSIVVPATSFATIVVSTRPSPVIFCNPS